MPTTVLRPPRAFDVDARSCRTPRRSASLRAVLLAVAVCLGAAREAEGQITRQHSIRYQANDAGEIVLRGNSLTTCSPTGTNGAACGGALAHTGSVGAANNALNNNNYTMVYVDVDGDPSTFSSSRSTLSIPVGASVLWAGLYWSGRTDNPLRNTMRFRTPASPGYVSLVADQLDLYTADTPDAYQGFKDVTALVQAGGSGVYVGANVQTTVNTSNQYASWALVVVLRDPSKPLRNLTVFDGFANISGSSAVNVTVSGFLTPALGTPTTFIGLVTYEGDRGIVGDQMLVNGAVQSNTINATNNFFNSTVADTTTYRTAGQDPAYTNNVGIDIKTFRTAAVPAGATSALLRFTTTGDQYYPGVVTFQTDLFNPVINGNVVKSVRDRLGNLITSVVPGDTLRYDIAVSNTGQDGSVNTVLIDTIPAGVTYVPGSLQIVAGSNAGAKSDASGDDQAELLASPARVRFRLGTGANATVGGALAPAAATRVRFLVRINDSTPAGFLINNQAYVTATSQTLGSAINAASRDSAAAGGTPPTPTPVAGPNLTLAKTHVGDFPRGGSGTYTLTVSNIGTTASSITIPVVVVDTVPAPVVPTAATGTGWSCSIAGQVVTCSKPGAIGAGASTAPITLTVAVPVAAPASFTNVARVSGGGDNTPANNGASDLTVTVGVPDFTLTKTAVATPFVIGTTGQFRLRVRNIGSAANGSDLVVRDTLPAGLTFAAGTGTGFTCAATGQAVTCTRPGAQPVPVGDSVDVLLTVNVAAAAAPAVGNTARVENGDDPNAANNVGTVSGVPVLASVDLALDKAPVGVFTVGQNATWRLRVRAVGPSPAPAPITLLDSLHAGFTFVAASGGGFTCSLAAPLVTCTRATGLASGDSAIVQLTALVGAAALPTAGNTARVSAAGDANAANDTARVTGVPIVGVPDLTLTKTAGGAFVTSQPATYTLRVANIGSAPAGDSIVVTDSLPTGLTFGSATGPGFTCAFTAPTVRCVRTAPLAGGSTVDVTLAVTPTAAALPQVTNRATVRTPADPSAANDTGVVVSPVVSVPDLAIGKTFTGPMTIGQPATYRLLVRNVSPGPTTSTITVTDSLPAGLGFGSATGTGFTCGFAAPFVTCTRAAAIAAGDSVAVTLTVTPAAAIAASVTNRAWVATAGDLNAFNDTSVTPPRAVQRPDLSIIKSHTGAFSALDTLGTIVDTWTLTLSNIGTAATTGTITVVDSLPANVAFVSTPSPGWSCTTAGTLAAGIAVTCTNPGPLAPAATAALLLRVSARPAAAGTPTNIARVTTPDDVNGANDRATDPTTITAAPDLRLVKSNNATSGAQVLPLEVGAPDQRYRFAVTNVGAGPTTGPIVLVDTLPRGILFTASAGGGGFSCAVTDSVPGPSPRRRIVTCTRAAALAAGATAQDSITIAVLAEAIPSVANTAQVTTAGDPNPANDRATDGATPVVNPLDLTVGKSPQGTFTIGSTATYQISVTNLGSGTSTLATTVVDTLAPGLTFVSAAGDNFTCSVTSTVPGPPTRQVVTCTRPAGGPSATNGIESGTVYGFDLVVSVAAAALPAQDNRVWVANGDDTNATNNSFATGQVLVVSPIDLALTKSPVGPIVVNATATFNLAVANIGASATTGTITITDTLPTGLGLTSVSNTGGGFGACTVPDSVPGPSPRRRIVQCVRPAAPALGAGAQATLALEVSVAPTAFPAVQNAARVATTGDLNPANDTSTTAVLPVTSVPDFSLVKTGSSPLQVGVPAAFELVVANASPISPGGNTAAIVVTDTLPVGLAFDAPATAANPRTIASGFTCSVSTIAGPRDVVTCTRGGPPGTPALVQGEEVTLVLLANVTAGAVGTLVNTAHLATTGDERLSNNSSTTAVLAVVQPELTVSKAASPSPFVRGQTGQYAITVANGGTGATTGTTTVVDDLAPGLEFLSAVEAGWSCAATGTVASGQQVTCTSAAPIAAGASGLLTLRVRVDAGAAATVANTVAVSTPNEGNTGNNTFTLPATPVTSAPDLALATAAVGPWTRNQNATFTVTPTNVGSAPTSGSTTITTTLPAGTTFVGATGGDWACTASGLVVTCTTATSIAVGAPFPVTITVAVGPTAAPSLTVPSTVSTPGDANASNDPAQFTTPVGTAPDVATSKSLTSTLIAGQAATFRIVVRNVGSAVATGPITLTDVLDPALTYVVGTGGAFGCGVSGQTVTCTRSTALAAGDSAVVTLNVTVAAAASGTITNVATATAPDDPNIGNDSGTTGALPVGAAPDLALAGTITGPVVAGQSVPVQFTPTNAGSAPTTGPTTLTVTLPAGVAFTGSTGAGWSCGQVGQVVTCTTPDPIPVSGAAPVTLTVTLPTTQTSPVSFPATVSTAGDGNPANDAASPSAPVTTAPDVALTGAVVGPLTAGQPATIRYVPRNAGSAPTSGPTSVAITLPTGTTWNGTNPAGYTCVAAGQLLTCTTATTLAVGDSLPFAIGVTTAPTLAGTVAFPATASTPGDANAANNGASPSAAVGSAPDLALTGSAGPLVAGQPGPVRFVPRNVGSATAGGPTTVTVTLPSGVTWDGINPPGYACTVTGASLACVTSTPIAAGDSLPLTITVNVPSGATGPLAFPGTVATAGDPNPANDAATPSTPLGAAPDLALGGAFTGPVVAGQPTAVRFVPRNVGSAATAGATTVTLTLPTGTTWDGANPPAYTCTLTGASLACVTATPIAAGDSLPLTIGLSTSSTLTGPVSVPGTVGTAGDPNPTNNAATPSVPVGTAPDLTLTGTAGPFVAGQPGPVRFVPRNTGSAPTSGPTTVTVTLPAGTTWNGQNPPGYTCTVVATSLSCTTSTTLAPGDSLPLPIVVTVAPGTPGPLAFPGTVSTAGDPNPGNNAASPSAPVLVAPDLAVSVAAVGPIIATQPGTLRFIARNVGGAPTTGTSTLTGTLPPGVTFTSASAPAGWSCSAAGQVVTCTTSQPVAVGDSAVVDVAVGVAASAAPQIIVTATVATPGDGNAANDAASATIPVSTAPDLTVTSTVPGPILVGRPGTITQVPVNRGSAPTTGTTTVTTTLPPGVTYTGATGPGWSCTAAGPVVTCTNPAPIAPGDSAPVTIIVTAAPSAAPGGPFPVTVGTSGVPDANPGNNGAAPFVPISLAPDLTVAKAAQGAFTVGAPATYTLTVSNVGSGPTTGLITLIDSLPPTLTFQSATGPGFACTASAGVVTCTRSTALPAGETAVVALVVQPTEAAVPQVVNVARVSTPGDPEPTNDRTTVTTPVSGVLNLALTKTGADTIAVGGAALWSIGVRNAGSLTIPAPFTVIDSLPPGIGFVSASGTDFTCTAAGSVVSCVRTTPLAPGISVPIALFGSVSQAAFPAVTNRVAANVPNDAVPGDNVAAKPSVVTGVVNLALRKTAAAPALTAGLQGTFFLDVRNIGTIPTQGAVTIVDSLPTGLTFSQASGAGFTCTGSGAIVSCTRTTPMAVGDSARVTVVATVGFGASGTLTNVAVANTPLETLLGDNRGTAQVQVAGDFRLVVEKQSAAPAVQVGATNDYTIVVRNVGASPVPDVQVTDQLPRGFLLVPGSVRIDGTAAPDPDGAPAPTLVFQAGTLAPGGERRITYRTRLTAAVQDGRSVNTATAASRTVPLSAPANAATAAVQVRRAVFSDRGVVVGKVFAQCDCGDAKQTAGELGVPGVRVVLEDGTAAITDAEGKFNFWDVPSGLHVVRIDPATLPAGARLVALGNRNGRDGGSRFVDLKGGELHRADFALASDADVYDAVLQRRRRGEPTAAMAPRDSSTSGTAPAPVASTPPVDTIPAAAQLPLTDRPSNLPVTPLRARQRGATLLPSAQGRVEIVLPSRTIPADGVSVIPVTVRVLDAGGTPITGRTAALLETSMGVWLDAGPLDPSLAGPQVTITDGVGEFRLAAAGTPGLGEIRVTTNGAEGLVPVRFVPAARSLFVTGLVNARLDARVFGRGDYQFAAGDRFERLLRSAAFGDDSSALRGGVRGALYAKGTVLGDKLLTLGWDSERNPDRTQFRDIDPDLMFPTYGDASLREFDAQTQRRFYARVDQGQSFARIGDFQTQRSGEARLLGAWDRSLTGVQWHGEGAAGVLNVYGARTSIRQLVDEVPGRGLSGPYFLSRLPVINSERVELVTRDRNQPSLILKLRPMQRFADYLVEAGTNRVVFRAPVPSLDEQFNPVSVRVTYEVEQAGEQFTTAGADGTWRVGDVELGGVVAVDQNPLDSLRLLGLNGAWKIGGKTLALAEYATARGMGGTTGDAMRMEVRHGGARAEWRLYGAQTDAGFDNRSSPFGRGRREFGARMAARLGVGTRLLAEALLTEDRVTGGERRGASVGVEQVLASWLRAEVGVRWAEETAAPATPTSVGLVAPPSFTAFRAKLMAQPWAKTSFFGEAERAVRGDVMRWSVGGEHRLPGRARLYARHEAIDGFGGPFALARGQRQGNTVFGIDADWIRNSQVFSEYRARDAFNGRDVEASMGLRNRWAVAQGLLVNTSLERVSPLVQGVTSRGPQTAIAGAVEWTRREATKVNGRAEWRTGSGTTSWLGSAGLAQKLSRDLTFLARTLYDETPLLAVDRWRSHAGLAWRQTDRNDWNALLRYEHLRDRQGGALPVANERHLVHTLANWQPQSRLTLSGRVAAQWTTTTADALSTATASQLLLGRAIYDLTRDWDVGLLSSVVTSEGLRQRQLNFGLELGRIVAKNLRVAAGWNTHGYSDRVSNAFGYTSRGLYVDLGFKFDESLFQRTPAPAPAGGSR